MEHSKQSKNIKMTQEQINEIAVRNNQSYNFKTTADNCKETKLFDLVRSGTHTIIDLIAAERYDEKEWYKARAAYLEKRVAELEEKYENKDDEEEDEDEERLVCGVCFEMEPKDVCWEFDPTVEDNVVCPKCRETNWNEDGEDELCSAIDASGNALY